MTLDVVWRVRMSAPPCFAARNKLMSDEQALEFLARGFFLLRRIASVLAGAPTAGLCGAAALCVKTDGEVLVHNPGSGGHFPRHCGV